MRDRIMGMDGLGQSQRGPYGAQDVVELVDEGLNKMIRVYPDGVRVGCTFVTKKAFEKIASEVQEKWRTA